MVAPPYVFAAIVAMCVSISSDRRSERYSHLVIPLVFGMVGYIIAAATTGLATRYFSLALLDARRCIRWLQCFHRLDLVYGELPLLNV